MGELLLCSGSVAAIPFYIEGVSVNIYSLEELCYYIASNTYLMDKNFISEELILWIENEAKSPALASRLRQLLQKNKKLSDYIGEIFQECRYCSPQEAEEILRILQEMEEKTDFECNKIRADRLMEKEKYLSCIYEYKRLLDMEGAEGQTPELMGDIWHNLGTAYARMFLFEEAVGCFERAFSLNQNPESAKARLFSCKCMQRDIDYMRIAHEYGLDDTALAALQKEFEARCSTTAVQQLRERLEDISKLEKNGQREYRQQIQNMIFEWKEEYRRISKA